MERSIGGAALFSIAAACFACSAPSGEAKLQSATSSESGDAGQSATPPDPDKWGRAEAGADPTPHHDAGKSDASVGDGTAYTLGSVACGAGNACGTSAAVCCVSEEQLTCKRFDDPCHGFAITCDGPEDCGMGEVCCASGQRVACDSMGASHCPSGQGESTTIACHTDADCKGSAPWCEREKTEYVDLRLCHRTCKSANDCTPWGMLYCYVAPDSNVAEPLCHSWPPPHGF